MWIRVCLMLAVISAGDDVLGIAVPSPSGHSCGHTLEKRIASGAAASAKDWPWLAAIFANNDFVCGGVLVSDRHIVTAAECLVWPGTLEVYFGVTHPENVTKDPHGKNEGFV